MPAFGGSVNYGVDHMVDKSSNESVVVLVTALMVAMVMTALVVVAIVTALVVVMGAT